MMRKWWVIPFLLLASFAQAQDFKAGAVFGVNGAQLDGDGMGGYNKPGLYGGLYVSREINDAFFWQFELVYSGKGSQRVVRPETLDDGPWLRLSMHYIDIPVTVHYKYTDAWHFHAGVGINYLMGFNYRDPRLNLLNTNFTNFEAALHLGTSYELMKDLEVFGRFSYSMFSVDPGGPRVPFFAVLQQGAFNNLITLGVRYQLKG
jgi:hypothetical protein